MSGTRFRAWHTAIVSLLLIAALYLVARYVRAPRMTDEMRGYVLAEKLGCHGCHGPRGTGGTPNPGSEELEIPSWDGGAAMMYVEAESEFSEWILDGVPRRLAGKPGRAQANGHENGPGHEAAQRHAPDEARHAPPVHMPAYRSIIDDRELDLLIAYVKAVALWDTVPERAMRGRRAAGRLGCFGCHGPGGLAGAANPGSFKGYIPPWRGKDFAELVRDESELRSWILDGKITRFESNRIARLFTRRQSIQMPAYRTVLTQEELDDIVAYIQHISREGAR